jgi:dolichyl-phosphate-mannose--protein O-mannosyl transferase
MNGEMLRSSIVSMGNPLLWWMFIPALAGLVPQSLIGGKRGKAGALFLLLSIFLMFAPYLFMGRIKFMYYFLSFVPLAALAFCLGLKKLVEMGWITARCALVYAVLTIITFAMYYPVLSGTFIDPDYAGKWLNALKSWRLV